MVATATKKKISVEEFYELSTTTDKRLELVNGEVIEMAPAGMEHGEIASNLLTFVSVYNAKNKLGKVFDSSTGYNLPNGNVRAPDVSFVRGEKFPDGKSPKGFGKMTPDLAVEVISPSDKMSDVLNKVDEYLDCGTYVVWVVDADKKTVTVFKKGKYTTLSENDTLTEDLLLPGFSLKVKDIF